MFFTATAVGQVTFPSDALGDASITAPAGISTYFEADHPPVACSVLAVGDLPETVGFPLDKVSWIRTDSDGLPVFTCMTSADRDTLYITCTAIGGSGTYVIFTGIQ